MARRRPVAELHHNSVPQVCQQTVQQHVFEKDKIQKHPAMERLTLAPRHMQKRLEWTQK